jgi:hypothetical protein
MAPYAETVLEEEPTAIVVLDRCLGLRERNMLIQACLGWPEPVPDRTASAQDARRAFPRPEPPRRP